MKDKIYNSLRKIILNIANKKYPSIRKRKYSLEYYLKNFVHVLKDVVHWSSLRLINKNEKSFHWKTIYNEFNRWTNDNIFEDAFYTFIRTKYFKISQVKKHKKINLFIDVSKIINKLGSEGVTINCENKKKNITPLTMVCDQNKLPLCISNIETNRVIYNKRKTAKHEIKNVQRTLDKIVINVKDYMEVNLIGDRGYITSEKFDVMDRKLPIITPKRKNQKKKIITHKEKLLLKERHKIENVFAIMNNNHRVMVRRDKNINNYFSFVYMTMLEIHIKYAYKHNLEKYVK
jgi:hypothetical protein